MEQKNESTMPKSMIYTKKGDDGTTCASDLVRRRKDELIFECLGQLDELNARVGCLSLYSRAEHDALFNGFFEKIQHMIFKISNILAMPKRDDEFMDEYTATLLGRKLCLYGNDRGGDISLHTLEAWIDKLDARCPPIKNFILPGGTALACQLHACRTQCRLVERRIVSYMTEHVIFEYDKPTIVPFINRLSDFFFVAARYANATTGVKDTLHVN
jgi:cob(I)alamin adenosyltransferase